MSASVRGALPARPRNAANRPLAAFPPRPRPAGSIRTPRASRYVKTTLSPGSSFRYSRIALGIVTWPLVVTVLSMDRPRGITVLPMVILGADRGKGADAGARGDDRVSSPTR